MAKVELRRSVRRILDSPRMAIIGTIGVAVGLAYAVATLTGGYLFGRELAQGDSQLLVVARGASVGLVGIVTFVVAQRTVKRLGRPDGLQGMLTVVPDRDLLAGVLLAEYIRVSLVVVPFTFCLAVGLAAGSRSGFALPATGFMALLVVVLGLLLGYTVGISAKLLAARSQFVANHKTAIAMVVSLSFPVAYFGAFSDSSTVLNALEVVSVVPQAWVGDLLVLASGGSGSVALAGVGLGTVLASILALGWVATTLSSWLWHTESVEPDTTVRESSLVDRLLAGPLSVTVRQVVRKSWLRARRAPITVQFAFTPVFIVVYFAIMFGIEGGGQPAILVAVTAVAGAMATGAAFTLNPVGGESTVLPAVLTSRVDGRQFIRGLALAGLVPGLAVTVAGTLAMALYVGVTPATGAFAVGTAVVCCLGAPGLAAAAGIAFPKYETRSLRGREVVVPSGVAFSLYSVALAVVAAPALATQFVVTSLPGALPGPVTVVRIAGLAVSTMLSLVGGYGGVRIAARRFDSFHQE